MLASFPGSTDYSSGSVSETFIIGQATPSVIVSITGGTYTGSPFLATTSSLEGVAPTLTYYAGTSATGTALSGAPTSAGTYTVLASFPGSTDFTSGSVSETFSIGKATPSVIVSIAGGTYTGSSFMATTSALEGVTPTLNYYTGTSATGTPLSGTPTSAGTYTVSASFPGSTDYTSGSVSETFTIGKATPNVIVSDAGGPYSGSTYPATGTVDGGNSLEGVSPTLTYYAGTNATGTALSGAPSAVGTYTVLASFAGSADYTTATSSALTFSISNISQTTPTVTVSDVGGTYDGSTFPATATVNDGSSLEGVTSTLTYYAGTSATGTALSGAPTSAGTYTVLASFPGSADYISGSASATFTITQATPSVAVSDAGGTYSGSSFPGTTSGLEGVTPTLTYYAGTSATGTALSAHRPPRERTRCWPASPAARITPVEPPARRSRSPRPRPASRSAMRAARTAARRSRRRHLAWKGLRQH